MTTRRDTLFALGAGALTASLEAFAQPPGRVWRIGFISPRAVKGANEEIFEQGLRELGYVNGKSIVIEWRFAKGNVDSYPALAEDLVRSKLDCMVINSINAALAANQATRTIPIVLVVDDDPVRHGLATSLARPGGNLTGFVTFGPDLAGKRLELLKEILPKASRVAILWERRSLPGASHFRETEAAARVLGMQLQSLDVLGPQPEVLDEAFRAALKWRAQALVVVGTGFTNVHETRITALAADSKLPAMYTGPQFVTRAEGLMSYAPSAGSIWRHVAAYVDRILKGAKPGDLPIEQPTTFELTINLKAAKRIGLVIPPGVLSRANKVIE